MHHAEGGAVKTAVKAVLIVCAAAVCVMRFVAFKYEAALPPELRRAMLPASVVCAALCALCAALWVILEKKGKNGA